MAVGRTRCGIIVGAAFGAVLLAACGGSSGSGSATTAASSCAPAKAGEKVSLSFTSWVPGMQKTVDLWNQQNPDIQVAYKEVATGNSGTYQSYANQIKAGNAGDLGMIEFDSLPSFRLQDGVANIGSCPGVKEATDKYVPWTIDQVRFGEAGAIYGIPQDIGPLALYYRKDLFEQAGIAVPKTWDEYATAAATIKAKGAFITNLPPDQPAYFAGLVWQNGAKWFSNKDGKWTVNLTDAKTMQVADYWQKMIDQKLVDAQPQFNNSEYKALGDGQQWTLISAAWYAKLMQDNVPGTSGKWAVAPMPQWKSGDSVASNWGGSTTVVFKGSKHPAEAAKFATWAFGNVDALALNNANGGQYPASKEGQEKVPTLTQPSPYFGGQVIWKTFADAAGKVDQSWQWGPTMTQTFADFGNGLGAAVNGQSTIGEALQQAQAKTITAMKSQAIEVAG